MQSTYVAKRLREWAEWSWTRHDGAWGHVSQCQYREPLHCQEWRVNLPSDSSECSETESGVGWLCVTQGPLGQTVLVHYRDHASWSGEVQSAWLGCSLRALWWRLGRAHDLLLGDFADRDAGIERPQMQRLDKLRRAA